MSEFILRRASADEGDVLFDLWWRSAAATHTFLAPDELQALAPSVRALRLETLDTWVLCELDTAQAIGFMVVDGPSVEALFIAPEGIRRGGGRLLIEHARSMHSPLHVDVNEQNTAALKFYLACGFRVIARSSTDHAGRPYPLLHLSE